MNQALKQKLHPDLLFDRPYEEHDLDISSYRWPSAPWSPEHVSESKLTFRNEEGFGLAIEAWGEGILRLRGARPGHVIEASTTERLGILKPASNFSALTFCETDGLLLATGDELELAVDRLSGAWSCRARGGTLLTECLRGFGFGLEPEHGGQRYFAEFSLGEEHIFGLGGRIHPVDRTGSTADMFAMKAGKLSGDYGGFPIPWFLSTRGYGIFVNNPWPHCYFDMGHSDPRRWWCHAPGGDCDLFIIYGPDFKQLVRRFTGIVGRIPRPERWWLGYWCSSLSFKSSIEVQSYAERFRREGYPLDAMVIDGPWRGGPEFLEKYMAEGEYPTNDVDWHPDFGDGPAMIQNLKDMQVKTVLHQNSRNFKDTTIESGIAAGNLRREGQEVVVRFGEPKAEAWYAEQIAPRYQEGVAMWWLDHGDRVSGEIRPGIPSRNLFGTLWALCLSRICESLGRNPSLSLIRGCGIGGQSHALPWPGDTRFGIDFFNEDIWFCLNAGLSGFPVTSADLGGFCDQGLHLGEHNHAFDPDNLARRLCQSIFFLPSPRVHANDSAPPKVPWNCPDEIAALYKAMLVERYRLTPYFYHLAWEAHLYGDPILRPMVYAFPHDSKGYLRNNQFMIGESLLVAPVLEKQREHWSLYLPPGRWIDYWNEDVYEGGQEITVEVPMFDVSGLPVFVRAGSIIPRQSPVEYLSEEPYEEITWHVYPDGDPCGAEFHEDAQCLLRVQCQPAGERWRVTVSDPRHAKRKHAVRMHGVAPRAVDLDVTS